MGRDSISNRGVFAFLAISAAMSSAFAQGGISIDTTKSVYVCALNADINNDGFGDFLISDFLFSSEGLGARGKVEARSGKTGLVLYTVLGNAANVNLGYSIASVGDIDLDGFPDWVAGEPGYGFDPLGGTYLGQVRAFSGKTGANLYTVGDTIPGRLGSSLTNMGDLDSDGAADFAAGAPDGGHVNVYSTRTGFLMKRIFLTPTNNAGFGSKLAGVGDVNQDGKPDLMIGWPNAHNAQGMQTGLAVIVGGTAIPNGYWPVLYQVQGEHNQSGFGSIGSGAGDWDGDTYADFALGAVSDSQGSTPLRIYSGKDGSVLISFPGFFGTALDKLGDLNNDAVEDFALGNSSDSTNGMNAGIVRVFSGKTGLVFNQYLGNTQEGLGYRVVRAGDVNGDSFKDLLIAGASAQTGSGVAKLVYQITGVTAYGVGSPGCLGKQTLTANTTAKIGFAGFRLTVTNAPTSSSAGNLMIGNAPMFSGANPFSLVLPLYVDLVGSTELYVVPMSASSTSSQSSVTIPIPNDPALIGRTYYNQVLWAWLTSTCTTPASANLSASNGLSFLIF